MHVPVLLEEVQSYAKQVLEFGGNIFVDVTAGYGGHSVALFNMLQKYYENNMGTFTLLSLEWDSKAIEYILTEYSSKVSEYLVFDHTSHSFADYQKFDTSGGVRWVLVRSNFAYLDEVLKGLAGLGIKNSVDFLLADLGVSTPQLEDRERGFSFRGDGVLDMRMAPDQYHVRAADLLNFLSESELVRMFKDSVGMPYRLAKAMAWNIVKERTYRPFGNRDDIKRIKNIASKIKPLRTGAKGRLASSTLVFLALRIAVNMELEHLKRLLRIVKDVLSKSGLALFIGFHSGEWSILEQGQKGLELLQVVTTTSYEIHKNPKSRSAKMFVFRNVSS